MTARRIFEATLPALAESLAGLRHGVFAAAQENGASEDEAWEVMTAIDEACQNVIRHAYGAVAPGGVPGDMVIEIDRDEDNLAVRVLDFAPPVDVAKICPRSLDDIRPGGLGVHFIRQVMDRVEFLPPPPGYGNLLSMTKRIGR